MGHLRSNNLTWGEHVLKNQPEMKCSQERRVHRTGRLYALLLHHERAGSRLMLQVAQKSLRYKARTRATTCPPESHLPPSLGLAPLGSPLCRGGRWHDSD